MVKNCSGRTPPCITAATTLQAFAASSAAVRWDEMPTDAMFRPVTSVFASCARLQVTHTKSKPSARGSFVRCVFIVSPPLLLARRPHVLTCGSARRRSTVQTASSALFFSTSPAGARHVNLWIGQ